MSESNRDRIKELAKKQAEERMKQFQVGMESNPIGNIIPDESGSDSKDDGPSTDMSSLQSRFGVQKINKPVKDAQLTARIDSRTLKQFKHIVKQLYYPDKSNINETVTQIIRAFVDEYNKSEEQRKQNTIEKPMDQ